MKKSLFGIILPFFILCFTGCEAKFLPQRREIDNLQLVQVIGIDPSESDPEKPMLTIASKNLETDGGQDSGQGGGGTGESGRSTVGKALIETAEGDTLFDAARNIQTHGDKTIFWSHTEYYLIGEDAAKENLIKYIDFFTRDHELRIEAKIYIVKGSTAKEMIEQSNLTNFYVTDNLESLGKNIKFIDTSEEMKISELMRFVDIHHSSARIPCIHLVSRDSEKGERVPDIEICGYAIIKDLKLVGFIGTDISRGINLITNKIGSSIVAVKDSSGGNVSLEIIRSKTKVIPRFDGDTLKEITLKTKVTSNLGEIQSQMDITNREETLYLQQQQSEVLKNEMESALKIVLQLKSDCLNICDRIRLRNPLKWEKIEDHWMELFSIVDYTVQVESEIQRTYQLKEPSGYKVNE